MKKEYDFSKGVKGKYSKKALTQEEMKEAAKSRSPNYKDLSPEQQWKEDKELGILDWDGN